VTDKTQMTEVEYFRDLIDRLFKLKHFSLDDGAYAVRERELKGWDGPAVTAYSDLVEELKKAKRKGGKLPDHVTTGKSAVELQTAQGVLNAAKALIADVRARYPGEELRCPHMRAIDEGLTKLAVYHWFFSPIGTRFVQAPDSKTQTLHTCEHPTRGLERCGLRVQSVGDNHMLASCNTIGCPRMAKAQ
jgi:hypothetical protein